MGLVLLNTATLETGLYLNSTPCKVNAQADKKARYRSINAAPTSKCGILPPKLKPITISIIPPKKNWYPQSAVVSSCFENILTSPEEIAADNPEKITKP